MYSIEITRHHVAYELDECTYIGQDDHTRDDCTGECTWLDGGSREISPATNELIVGCLEDQEDHGSFVAWAVEYLRALPYSFEPSSWPIPAEEPLRAWLSANDWQPDGTSIEVSVWLTGSEWTDQQRAEVFRRVTV